MPFPDVEPVFLTGYIDGRGGTGLDGYRPALAGLSDDRSVHGGLLPPGAVGAEVVDRAGARHAAEAENGVWLIVLDDAATGDSPPVRFFDSAGKTVRSPLPEDWRRADVDDAEEPCPACGSVAWEQVWPSDDSRGMGSSDGGEMEPSPFVVCCTCGHEEPVGVWVGLPLPLDAHEEDEGPDTAWLRERALRNAAVLREVDFPIYVAAGCIGPWRLVGWSRTGSRPGRGGLVGVTLADDEPEAADLSIDLELARESAHEMPRTAARRALQQSLDREMSWPDRSEGGLTVWLRSRERDLAAQAAAATEDEIRIPTEDNEVRFAIARSGDRWAAVGHHNDLVITLTGRQSKPEDVRLVRVADPAELTPD